MEDGDIYHRPRAVSRSKTRIDQWQTFIFFNSIHAFSKRRRENKLRRILHEPVGGTPRRFGRNFGAKNRRYDLPVFNINQNLARNLDPSLQRSNLKEITYLTHICTQKGQMSFVRDGPWNFAHVFYLPIPRPDLRFFFFFFFAEKCWSKVGHIFQKISTDENSGRKKKTSEIFAMTHRICVHNFTVWIENTAWTFAGEYICFFSREPACSCCTKMARVVYVLGAFQILTDRGLVWSGRIGSGLFRSG